MYIVKEQHLVGVFNGVKKYSAHIQADSVSDLPSYLNCKGIDGELTLGTSAIIADDGTKYLMNSSGEWKESNFSEAIRIKGRVDDVSELPDNAKAGWLYFVGAATDPECAEYVYTEEGTWEHIGEGVPIEIDDELSTTSENPVQNKVISTKLNDIDTEISTINDSVSEIESYIGILPNVLGLSVDYESKTCTRLGEAIGKTAGANFNIYTMPRRTSKISTPSPRKLSKGQRSEVCPPTTAA